jgi:WD40 repeat protein
MEKEIINRVSNSKLMTFDLEEIYPEGKRVVFDIKDWLFQEIILKEKDFRASVSNHDWSQYKNCFVAVSCSADAIIPSWAFMLIASELTPFANKVVIGDLELLETVIYQELIGFLDLKDLADKPVIIKGCANKPIPNSAYAFLIAKLQPIAKSIMFGEACSTVPLYKSKK